MMSDKECLQHQKNIIGLTNTPMLVEIVECIQEDEKIREGVIAILREATQNENNFPDIFTDSGLFITDLIEECDKLFPNALH